MSGHNTRICLRAIALIEELERIVANEYDDTVEGAADTIADLEQLAHTLAD